MIRREEWPKEMPELSAKIMREHYKRNLDYVLSYMADDILWIGPLESQFICGKEKMKEFLTPEQEVPVSVSEMNFQMVSYDDSLCIVAGKLRAHTRAETGLVLDVEQRYTFCWKRTADTPIITHIHGSNPWEFVAPEEAFPFQAGRHAYRFLEKMVSRRQQRLVFCDTNQREFFLEQNNIIYIESAKANSIIYYTSGAFEVKHSISQMTQILPTEFLRIHRCFSINIHHVTEVKRFEIIMDNMVRIPIPEKRYMEVKKQVEELLNKYGDDGKSLVSFEE